MRATAGLAGMFLFCSVAVAQEAVIVGAVKDQTGAVIPGVTITATNPNTGMTRTAMTNETGNYSGPHLPVGTYAIKAELAGFKTQVAEKVKLDVQQTARVDFTLEIGQVADQVTVTGVAPLLQTDDSQVGTVVENRKVVDLPLNGRNFTQLNLLVAGVVESTPGSTASRHLAGDRGTGVAFSVHGQRSNFNGFLIDGIQGKEYQHETNSVSPSIDAIQEFRVQTSNYDAEFGTEAGGQVNLVIKSGSNELHGTAFEFHRNDNLDAKNFFAPARPEFKRNQFGGSLGGPVVRDRLFFLGSYEVNRLRDTLTQRALVPDAKLRAGDFSDLLGGGIQLRDPSTGAPFPGNVIPPSRFT